MANVPSANTSVNDTAGAIASGLEICCVLAPCATSADITPRLFGGADAVYAQHGYCEGLEYSALHFDQTNKSILFVGLPIDTPGAIQYFDAGGSGTSVASVAAGAAGCLSEHRGSIKVLTGGVVGTDQILLELSLDDNRLTKKLRLGNALSYVLPYVNVTAAFSVGTLVAGETVITWFGSGPRASTDSVHAARLELANGQDAFRTALLIGDVQNSTEASAFLSEISSYETANDRFVLGRASIKDRLPLPRMSRSRPKMQGSPSLTFAASGHTITRATGSFLTDGFVVGDSATVTGSASNNVTAVITVLTATVMTFAAGLANETIATAAISGSPLLTFDGTAHTITRSRGSFLTDGLAVGDTVVIAGSLLNNVTAVITVLTATVMTFAAGLANETIASGVVTITKSVTKAAWMASSGAAFATVDAARRIDLAAGRGRVISPFSGWDYRRPASWAASIREYQRDIHIPTWRKDDGPTGFDLFEYDASGKRKLVEWDDRADGGAGSAARFTTFRTWGNGPLGAFLTLSLTRDSEGSLLSESHNVEVVNLACTIVQTATERFIGRTPELNDDGTATTGELSQFQGEVNTALEGALLVDAKGEGKRASKAVWTPSAADVLNVPEATLNGTLDLNLNGTIHTVNTVVRVRSGGQ